jgi:response regulator RpfG family c-di-GMP phosphodiesterase
MEKILLVDDEEHVLESFRRSLRGRFEVSTAVGPEQGLAILDLAGPFAVVVSDLKMPGMNGVEFLAKVRDKTPLTVRMILTGHADVESAIKSVNDGNVFRFLTKPCPTDVLIRTIEAALAQYRLATAEKELLRGTLRGSVRVLMDILSLVNPEAFGRGERVTRLMMRVVKELGIKVTLKYELAGMLCQIGLVAVPQEILAKKFHGEKLSPEEEQIYQMHPSVAANLLAQIPRLEEVTAIIANQRDPYSTEGKLPLGARILNLCLDFDGLCLAGLDMKSAFEELRRHAHDEDQRLITAFERAVFGDLGYVPRTVAMAEIGPGMILSQNLIGASQDPKNPGVLLLAKGQELTPLALERLFQIGRSYVMPKTVEVLVPIGPRLEER